MVNPARRLRRALARAARRALGRHPTAAAAFDASAMPGTPEKDAARASASPYFLRRHTARTPATSACCGGVPAASSAARTERARIVEARAVTRAEVSSVGLATGWPGCSRMACTTRR